MKRTISRFLDPSTPLRAGFTTSRLRALRDHDFRFPILDFRSTISRLRALRGPALPDPALASRILSYTMGIIGFGACLAFLAALLFLSCGG